MLTDGGVQNTIPSGVLRNKGCKVVIAIDVNPSRGYGTNSFKLIDVVAASIRIMMKSNAEKGRMYADIVISPDTKRFRASKIDGGVEMIEEGYRATMEAMPQIKKLLKIKEKVVKIKKPKKLKPQNEMQMEHVIEE
jgi:predicted acylesterase/phospholipase RssA